eukprot:CAMPEP_0197636792 /NCGR_PEP_ID=MMETSP1338-20131121/12194_1 /TAXON_ID=43686 ORGANISM="Pelagodinium beii, Strain RCC1491" /NCGR_SAMPLE_ID=MMETSP1338 /ASSEMBLY_ACC=CAM_ASM_000754 /LENGTH=34 /DNA_ID= /DNA_START= /DNA_END= /DNA_ORIENTATION=
MTLNEIRGKRCLNCSIALTQERQGGSEINNLIEP